MALSADTSKVKSVLCFTTETRKIWVCLFLFIYIEKYSCFRWGVMMVGYQNIKIEILKVFNKTSIDRKFSINSHHLEIPQLELSFGTHLALD